MPTIIYCKLLKEDLVGQAWDVEAKEKTLVLVNTKQNK